MNWKKIAAWLLALLLTVSPGLGESGDFDVTVENPPPLKDIKADTPFLPAGAEPVVTENSYVSADVAIAITAGRYKDKSDYYAADIHIRDMGCIRHVFSGKGFADTSARVGDISQQSAAVLSVNGDYASAISSGVVIAQGQVIRNTKNATRDLCVLYDNGVMACLPAGNGLDGEQLAAAGAWHTFVFGPGLMDENGLPLTEFTSKVNVENPRTAIGYYSPGHYCLVVVDGRSGKNHGLRLAELAALMAELGCVQAYNLDGGQSSVMWFNGKIVNQPYKNGRKLEDIVLICDLPPQE